MFPDDVVSVCPNAAMTPIAVVSQPATRFYPEIKNKLLEVVGCHLPRYTLAVVHLAKFLNLSRRQNVDVPNVDLAGLDDHCWYSPLSAFATCSFDGQSLGACRDSML